MAAEIDDRHELRESLKLMFDLFKHTTTLSTGTILLLATVIRDSALSKEAIISFNSAIFFLIASVLASLICMFHFAACQRKDYPTTSDSIGIIVAVFLIACASFTIGLFQTVSCLTSVYSEKHPKAAWNGAAAIVPEHEKSLQCMRDGYEIR